MSGNRPPASDDSPGEREPRDPKAQRADPGTVLESDDARSLDSGRRRVRSTRAPNTLLNALVGAAVTVITALFVPLSPVLGGAVAGYLEGANADSGLTVGALSGVIALVPLLVIVPLVLFVSVLEPIAAVGILFIFAIAVGFLALYTVGFGALGGVLGVYLHDEFGSNRD